MNWRLLVFIVFIPLSVFGQHSSNEPLPTMSISGELKKWHKITLTFDGPETNENNPYNPFLNYRFDVTFNNGSKTYRIPGYFDADGQAAETSATAGNKWRVHFAPDEIGEWQYRVSFRKGANVAVSELACAQFFYENDPYHHHIVIHNGQPFYDLLGPESKYTGLSIQTDREDFANVHNAVLKWRKLSEERDKNWANAVDEPGDHRYSLVPDQVNPEHNNARQNALWGALMAGAWGIEWYFGYENVHSDLTCEDWRTRDKMWDQSRFALQFFTQNNIPFWDMNPMDHLTENDNDFILGKAGDIYIVYQKMGQKKQIVIPELEGQFDAQWFNPRIGDWVGKKQSITAKGELKIGLPPNSPEKDWVILIRK